MKQWRPFKKAHLDRLPRPCALSKYMVENWFLICKIRERYWKHSANYRVKLSGYSCFSTTPSLRRKDQVQYAMTLQKARIKEGVVQDFKSSHSWPAIFLNSPNVIKSLSNAWTDRNSKCVFLRRAAHTYNYLWKWNNLSLAKLTVVDCYISTGAPGGLIEVFTEDIIRKDLARVTSQFDMATEG